MVAIIAAATTSAKSATWCVKRTSDLLDLRSEPHSALDKLAIESGGNGVRVNKLEELPKVAATLSAEAHAEYVLGFTPPERARDGKYHTIKVEVLRPATGSSA